jgi:hypothetical protein
MPVYNQNFFKAGFLGYKIIFFSMLVERSLFSLAYEFL